MTTTEDIGTVETTPVTEVVEAPTEAPTEVTIEVATEPTQEVIDEQVNSLSEQDMDDLLKAITDGFDNEEVVKEEVISRPTYFEQQEKDVEEPVMTEEELEALDTLISEQEKNISTLTTQLEEANKQIEAEKQKQNDIEELWGKIMEDPNIGPFAIQIAEGKTPDIPDVLLKQLQKEISSVPNIAGVEQVSVVPKMLTAAERIYQTKTM